MLKYTMANKHHFVPAAYLKRFANPRTKKLIVYDIEKKQFREQSPDRILKIGNYYRQYWAPDGVDPDIFEKEALANLEGNVFPLFDILVDNHANLSGEQLSYIVEYLETQRLRVPRQAKAVNALEQKMAEQLLMSEAPDLLENIKIEISGRESHFRMMKTLSGNILRPYFLNMKWTIYSAPEGYSYVTSDSPVCFINRKMPPPYEAGIGQLGTIVLFPISKQHFLELAHTDDLNERYNDPLKILPVPTIPDEGVWLDIGRESHTSTQLNKANSFIIALSDSIVVASDKEMIENNLHYRA